MAGSSTPHFAHLARRPSERLAIVAHVRGTANVQETEYLEWKSEYDLSQRPGAAATARQMIGMANRDGVSATRYAEGHAYILIGVEPGNVPGVPQWDSSEVEDWLGRFVEADLRYDVHYVTYEEKEVLVLTIDAPRAGDPIYSLQRSSTDPVTRKSLDAGTIYVRHGSSTAPATPEDVRRLAARASATSATTLDLAVELDASKVEVIDPRILADDHRDRTLASWRRQMRAALPRRETGPFAPVNMRRLEDVRSEEEYLAEIDHYIESAKRAPGAWWGIMAEAWLEAERSILGVRIVNRFEENYENTVLELTFELPRAGVHLRAGEVSEVVGLPDRPHRWGRSALDSIAARDVVAVNRKPEAEIERVDEARTLVRYPEVRVRPHTQHALQPLLLALSPTLAGGAISVHWRVTASNAKSDQSGSIELRVPGEPAAEPQKAEPQEEVA